MKTKNYYVELLRFIFCVMILFHHTGLLPFEGNQLLPSGGVIADAFFMITGYFACKHIDQMVGKPEAPMGYAVKYTINKLLRTLPYVIAGVIIAYAFDLTHLEAGATVGTYFSKFWNMTAEILLLPMTGVVRTDLVSYMDAPLWYLSALLLALPVVMYVAMRFEDTFKNYIVWFAPMLLEGWMVKTYGGALPWSDYAGFVHSGAIRGIAGITLGCGVYYASKKMSSIWVDITTAKRVVVTVIELLLLIVLVANIYRGVNTYDEIATIYIIALMLALTLSEITYTSRLQLGSFGYLGSLSLPVYCIHWGVFRWVGAYLGSLGFVADLSIAIGACLIIAIVMVTVNNRIREKSNG